MTNQEIARIFWEMGALYQMKNETFKARAYDKVALLIEGLPQEVQQIYSKDGLKGILKLPGVGKRIAEHIEQLLTKGDFPEHQMEKKKLTVNVSELLLVEGVGPRNIKTLYEKLGIKNLEELEKAARAGKIRRLEHFGAKSEQKIIAGIEFLKKHGGRKLLGEVLPVAQYLEERIKTFKSIGKVQIAGSLRRKKETIGDIDFLVTSKNPKSVMDQFVALPKVVQVIAMGPTKCSVKLADGINADMRILKDEEFGSALLYFTGSQAHNIKMRHIAIGKKWKLSEYGLFDEKGKNLAEGKNEKQIYALFGMQYIEPELREDSGEIEAASENKLSKLIERKDLKGDLQVHSDWTDGKSSIEKVAEHAFKIGLEYIAITDHTKHLEITNGLDKERLLLQMKEIDELNTKFKKQGKSFKILKGSEVDILEDGNLDMDDETLSKLDIVGASIHYKFDLSREQQTERLVKTMRNPNVDIIFHLTTRVIGKRKGIDLDMEEIFRVAKETGTVLEIDSFIDRLDINEQYVRSCVNDGIKMAIDSDAHVLHHFDYLDYGVAQARRGWATKNDIINTLPVEKMLKMLKKSPF